jgi:glycosyltransferase involved in cell wall biosynthesis
MKILHLPLWIPNKNNVQLGNFIEQQIELSSLDNKVFTIGFIADDLINDIKIDKQQNSIIVTYQKNKIKFITFLNYLKAVKIALKELKKVNFNPQIIHCHVAGRNLWLAQKYFKEVPIVLSEHWSGYLTGEFKNQPFYIKHYLLNKINKCQLAISVSSHLTRALVDSGFKLKINEIANVIEVKEKVSIGNSPEMNFFVVADLEDHLKNISGILKAFQSIKNNYPLLKLHVVGDGKDLSLLKDLTNSLEINDMVSFLGRKVQIEIQELLIQADCVIVNSNFETFSMITLESVLTGCPVIATKCGGPEQFVNQMNGLLIEKNNCIELANAIEYMYLNKENYLPEKVRASVENKYTKNYIRKELNSSYNSI